MHKRITFSNNRCTMSRLHLGHTNASYHITSKLLNMFAVFAIIIFTTITFIAVVKNCKMFFILYSANLMKLLLLSNVQAFTITLSMRCGWRIAGIGALHFDRYLSSNPSSILCKTTTSSYILTSYQFVQNHPQFFQRFIIVIQVLITHSFLSH